MTFLIKIKQKENRINERIRKIESLTSNTEQLKSVSLPMVTQHYE